METPSPFDDARGQGRRVVGQVIDHGRSPQRYEKNDRSSDVIFLSIRLLSLQRYRPPAPEFSEPGGIISHLVSLAATRHPQINNTEIINTTIMAFLR